MGDIPFLRQTTLFADPRQAGRYEVELSPEWNAPFTPQGGLMTAIAARAMETHLGRPEQQLRTITAMFVSQISPGPVFVDVSLLRAGRRMSQLTATLTTAEGTVGLTTVAVFGSDRRGFVFTDATMPEVPPADECPSFRDTPRDATGIVPSPLWDLVEGRLAQGHHPWDNPAPTTSEQVYWYRFDDPPLRADGRMDRLAGLVLSDLMIGSAYERMGSGLPVWLAPSADLTVHLFEEAQSPWLLARNRARRADQGYLSLELELWDPDRRALCAFATQLALLTFPQGDVTQDLPAPEPE